MLLFWSLSCSATAEATKVPLFVIVMSVGAVMNDELVGPIDARAMFGVPLPVAPPADSTTLSPETVVN